MTATTTETNPANAAEAPKRSPRRRGLTIVVIVVLAGLALYQLRPGGATPAPGTVSASQLQSRYGARVELVGVTALGGLVELRFRVLDKDKARPLFQAAMTGDKEHTEGMAMTQMPILVVEGSNKELHPPTGMHGKMGIKDGGSYFVMYANAANAVRPGAKVSVQFSNVRLEHVTAQV